MACQDSFEDRPGARRLATALVLQAGPARRGRDLADVAEARWPQVSAHCPTVQLRLGGDREAAPAAGAGSRESARRHGSSGRGDGFRVKTTPRPGSTCAVSRGPTRHSPRRGPCRLRRL